MNKSEDNSEMMIYFIRKALKLGWTDDHGEGYHKALILPGHESSTNNWAAEWYYYIVDGKEYNVPHWLPRVVDEQIEQLISNSCQGVN